MQLTDHVFEDKKKLPRGKKKEVDFFKK